MRNNSYNWSLVIIILLGFIPQILWAQIKLDSPYSRYGIGDLNTSNNAVTESLGGLSFSLNSPYRINTNNPASYAGIDSGSFVFDAGFGGLLLQSTSLSGTSQSNYFNLSHLKLAMPITRWLRASFGLMPYSTIGYDVNGVQQQDSIGEVNYRYTGNGGLNRFYLGLGVKVVKNLFVGANASYIFGSSEYNRETIMPDQSNVFKFRATNEFEVKSQYFDFGIQYKVRLSDPKKDKLNKKRPKYLQFGLVYAPEQKLNASLNQKGITYTTGSDDFEFVKDTIYIEDGGKDFIRIPAMMGGGLSYYSEGKWMIGFDMKLQDWSRYEAFGYNDSLTSSTSYHLGGAYTYKGINFRAGVRYFDSYLELKDHSIDDYGISFGVGFPLRANRLTVSYVDLGFEFGQRGTTDDGLVEQQYFKINLGITIRNTWFQRSKYL